MTGQPARVAEHLFRHSAGRITATLAGALGPAGLDLAEEAVADAFLQALRTWPYRGVPDNASGWLFRAARNRAIDLLRREQTQQAKLPLLAELDNAEPETGDSELALTLLCCHPDLPLTSQVALTLKTVGGLGTGEIAAALLTTPDTITRRLTRAKTWLRRQSPDALELPPEHLAVSRVDSVLSVLYLLFNEGYDPTTGDVAVRGELCVEAIRLAKLLTYSPRTDSPTVRALLALMLLQASRLPARADDRGELVLLDDQDRTRWDWAMIGEGTAMFAGACTGPALSVYHVEAAIALCHVAGGTSGHTDWARIRALYDDLLDLRDSPVIRVNRAIAVAMADGPQAGIAELRSLAADPALRRYPLLPAALGALHLRAGDRAAAARHYRRALELPCAAPQRRFLERRLAACAA